MHPLTMAVKSLTADEDRAFRDAVGSLPQPEDFDWQLPGTFDFVLLPESDFPKMSFLDEEPKLAKWLDEYQLEQITLKAKSSAEVIALFGETPTKLKR